MWLGRLVRKGYYIMDCLYGNNVYDHPILLLVRSGGARDWDVDGEVSHGAEIEGSNLVVKFYSLDFWNF